MTFEGEIKTLGDLWDLPEEIRFTFQTMQDEITELESVGAAEDEKAERLYEQIVWLKETLSALRLLTDSYGWQTNRSPIEMRQMVAEILDDCLADY